MVQPNLDALDRKILAVLQQDARITNARLAERVGLSPSACLARHRRLEDLGVIAGYRTEIAIERIRSTLRVIIQLKLKRHLPEDFRLLEALLQKDRRVVEAAEVSGVVDYYASLCVRDMADLRDCIDSLITAAPCIESVNSFVVMHPAKGFAGLPLE
jgi:DNA-binding Lrp family transcriptional regulator